MDAYLHRPSAPSMAFAALKKVEAVLVLARDEPSFFQALSTSPVQAVQEAGLDLTADELGALIDVLTGSKKSHFNKVPAKSNLDKMTVLRTQWARIKKDYGAP